MSEVTSEGSNTQGEGPKTNETNTNQVNVADLEARLKQLESTNARLLEESKAVKDKYKESQSLIEKAERERLEKEGNYQALLEKERQRLAQVETENKEVKRKVLNSNMTATIARLAGEVHSLEDVLNQPAFSHILKKGIDENTLTLSEDVAKEYLNELFTAKPYLKKSTNNPSVINNKPTFNTSAGVKGVDDLSTEEIEKLLKEKFGTKQ